MVQQRMHCLLDAFVIEETRDEENDDKSRSRNIHIPSAVNTTLQLFPLYLVPIIISSIVRRDLFQSISHCIHVCSQCLWLSEL